ncbi:MAG: hypothetical protein AAF206_17685 [Bacteroidota bacterium]
MSWQSVCQLNARRFMRSSVNLLWVFGLAGGLFVMSACGPTEIVSPSAQARIVQPGQHQAISLLPRCHHVGTVQQIGNVLGCDYLILTPDGDMLQPIIVEDPNFQFVDGQTVRFDYQLTTPGITCDLGTAIWVTCISLEEASLFQDSRMD